jgi:hypothetical protein
VWTDSAVDTSRPFAVVSHDSGGAEILSSYLLRRATPRLLVLEGPAVAIFERKLGAINRVPLEEAVQRSAWILAGTSWQSDLEWRAIVRARELGKHSVAFLDHWINYKERFLRAGRRWEMSTPRALRVANSAINACEWWKIPTSRTCGNCSLAAMAAGWHSGVGRSFSM